MTAAVTGTVTITANLILGWIQSKPAKLVYAVTRTIPFPSATGILGIYQVSIANEGKTEVESIACSIRVENATIKDKRIQGNPAINWTVTATNDMLAFSSSGLNAGERLEISILAESVKDLPPVPSVSLRGKGVVGVVRDEGKKQTGSLSLIAALVGILGGLGVLSQLLDRMGKTIRNVLRRRSKRKLPRLISDCYLLISVRALG